MQGATFRLQPAACLVSRFSLAYWHRLTPSGLLSESVPHLPRPRSGIVVGAVAPQHVVGRHVVGGCGVAAPLRYALHPIAGRVARPPVRRFRPKMALQVGLAQQAKTCQGAAVQSVARVGSGCICKHKDSIGSQGYGQVGKQILWFTESYS